MDVLDVWNSLSYVEGVLFTIWLAIMYWFKSWMDQKYK